MASFVILANSEDAEQVSRPSCGLCLFKADLGFGFCFFFLNCQLILRTVVISISLMINEAGKQLRQSSLSSLLKYGTSQIDSIHKTAQTLALFYSTAAVFGIIRYGVKMEHQN